MIRRFVLWAEWRKAYWDKIDTHPELFAFLHRMYARQHQEELKSKDLLGPTATLQWLTNKKCSHAASQPPEHACTKPLDVLFYTYAKRDTCLGVGEKIFNKLNTSEPTISCAYYQNTKHPVLKNDEHKGVPVISLHAKPSLHAFFRFLLLSPMVLFYSLRSKLVAKYVYTHPMTSMAHLLMICITTDSITRMLRQYRPRILISPNEQGGSDNSILFALGKKMGIHTIQYLHGCPTKQFVPFICDEYWSWSSHTKEMMLGNTDDPRVHTIGCLEYDARDGFASSIAKPKDIKERRILFFSQVGMDQAWDIHAEFNGIEILQEGMQRHPGPLKLRIRAHPNETSWQKELRKTLFSDIDHEVSTSRTPLAEDVAWATHIYTVSSNAIFSALLAGKPSYLLWNHELDEIYGRAFLPDEKIITEQKQVLQSLNELIEPNIQKDLAHKILGSPSAIDRATEIIAEIIFKC